MSITIACRDDHSVTPSAQLIHIRAYLHGGGEPYVGEVTRLGGVKK